jgi:hypothetical protein
MDDVVTTFIIEPIVVETWITNPSHGWPYVKFIVC